MRRLTLKLVVAALTFSLGLSSYVLFHQHEHVTSSTEVEARKLTLAFYEAANENDLETLDSIIADDCTFTINRNFLVDDKPYTIGKAEALARFTKPIKFTSFVSYAGEYEDKVEVLGVLIPQVGQPRDTIYGFKHIYANRQGHLQLVSAELTGQDCSRKDNSGLRPM
jgi:hypothetical protein